jgi:hypothetical protein
MSSLNDRWIEPGSKCDLCSRPKREGERWWDTHTSSGICGFTFNFCPECEKDREHETWEVMGKVIAEHRRKTEEYWNTHPEELAKHRRETEEYRRNCLDVDGLPLEWKRTRKERFWNWLRRLWYGPGFRAKKL